jgi:hypothetical protein
MFRLIPPAQQDSLVLMTAAGIEIALQTVVRLEESYLVVRGRMAGTTDTGRLFFVPYDQITYVGVQKVLAEAEIQALLGEPGPPTVTAQTAAAEQKPPEPAAESAPAAPADPSRPGSRPGAPSKEQLLERLRARSHTGTSFRPPSTR